MLTSRQEAILAAVIKEYTRTAVPVGSVHIIKRFAFDISPATMRAEMAELEEKGFLYQPHTSSGRVPTDKGYRYFVNSLMAQRDLTKKEQGVLQEELLKLKARNQRLARTAAKLLAALSHNLAITGLIEEETFFQSGIRDLVRQPDFTELDDICQVVETLDYLDNHVEKILDVLEEGEVGEVKTLIGKENPLSKNEQCSLVVARCTLDEDKPGIIAIMGPKRMHYDKNISLIKYMTDLLGQ